MQAISAQLFLPGSTVNTLDASTFIPAELNGHCVQQERIPSNSVVELGKSLLKAAGEGNTDKVRELMNNGAPFTSDWLGTSPLHFAAVNNHLETCDVLLRAGILRDARTKVDRTPLHMAAYEGHLPIVDMLISHGADIEATDMLKMTPLHWAVQNGHAHVVTHLLRKGANTGVTNKFDRTPLDIALETNRIDIFKLLEVITREPICEINTINDDYNQTEVIDLDDDDSTKQLELLEQTDEKESQCNMPSISLGTQTEEGANAQQVDMVDSMEILKEHGISFLPTDNNSSVIASAVENGHSLVLTEVGKQVFNSTKTLTKVPFRKMAVPVPLSSIQGRKLIRVTAEQLLAMATSPKNAFKNISSSSSTVNHNTSSSINNGDKRIKRIVMNKNKIILSRTPNLFKRLAKETQNSDIETITRRLAEAKRQAEEYKQMLKWKEAEAERYKRQLESIAQAQGK